jgi:hypothetical protein
MSCVLRPNRLGGCYINYQLSTASAPNTWLNKAKKLHKLALGASRDAKTSSVAPKKGPTLEKLTPKPPNHRNKSLARPDTIPFAVALNSPKLAKIYFANIRLHDSLPTKK